MTRHPGTWLVWAIAALFVASSSVHPLVSITVLAVAIVLATSLTAEGDRGSLRVILLIGAAFVVVRVVLFTLTGRAGATTIAVIPEMRLPGLLGGIRFGGALSLEVLATELADGMRLLSILAVTGALVTLTDPGRLVRLLPRSMRHVAVVVQVAVSFIPVLAERAREVREAQVMRGVRIRGPRGAAALVMPILAGSVDRAFEIGESLHARGFERTGATRYRAEVAGVGDRLIIAGALGAIVTALLASRGTAGSWSAYPVVSWPVLDPSLLVAPLLLAAPLLVAWLRVSRETRT